MPDVGVAESYAYNVLRELGARSQPTFAAMRESRGSVSGAASEIVVLTRFVRSSLPQATGPGVVNERGFSRLVRAANAARLAFHPNVARVRYVDLDGDAELAIATELVDGATLHDLVHETAAGLELQLRILLDVLSGLGAVHGLRDEEGPIGLFHGELCPANVVVGRDGVARIVDVFRPAPVRVRKGSEGIFHASPEALDIDGARQARADLYGVGVMLWEAIAQRALHHGDAEPSGILSILRSGNIQRPDDPEDPPWVRKLADVALTALAFDPNLRYRNANEMAADLRAAAGAQIAQGSAVAAHVQSVAGEAIRSRRTTFDPLASGSHKRTSGVRRSIDLEEGGVVTLVPDVVSEEVGFDVVRIADSSLMPPATSSAPPPRESGFASSANAPAQKPRLPAPTVEADIMREMLELHGLETSTEPGADGVRREGPHARLRPFPNPPMPPSSPPSSLARGVPTLDFPTIVAAEAIPARVAAGSVDRPSGVVPVGHVVPPGQVLVTPMPSSAPQLAPMVSASPMAFVPAPPPSTKTKRVARTLMLVAALVALVTIVVAGALAAHALRANHERALTSGERDVDRASAPQKVDQKVVAPSATK